MLTIIVYAASLSCRRRAQIGAEARTTILHIAVGDFFRYSPPMPSAASKPRVFHRTKLGRIIHGDSCAALRENLENASVDLIMTSPPFAMICKKEYGNVDADEYVAWFKPFAEQFRRVLKPSGSLVIDIGGAWIPGRPTRSLYHYELLIMLCREFGFHLAQEFYWWNPSKLPTPAEWVAVRRIRVKDAVNCIWWLSQTPWPKASNRRVLTPYSDAMRGLLKNGYRAKLSPGPSGHDISEKIAKDNGAAIPPNLIAIAHTESNSNYFRFCREHGIKPHPARFPAELPEYFIRMLTDTDDLVLDPFSGSCVTGEVAERLGRRWSCIELVERYLEGALGRFAANRDNATQPKRYVEYRLVHPGVLWNGNHAPPLAKDGGRKRKLPRQRGVISDSA